jgi:hypothetical protein
MANMDQLTELNVFSIGNNQLRQMENILYLRQFRALRLVNLAGNPVCADPEYHNYVLSHIPTLTYLDYRLVDVNLVQAAREQYQDEMLELEEADSKREEDASAALSASEHEGLMAVRAFPFPQPAARRLTNRRARGRRPPLSQEHRGGGEPCSPSQVDRMWGLRTTQGGVSQGKGKAI